MNFNDLINLAMRVNGPGLAIEGVKWLAKVRKNAERAKDVLKEGTLEELDAIHQEALNANANLDAALADAEKR